MPKNEAGFNPPDMRMDERTEEILNILRKEFPEAGSELCFGSVYELTVAVILSAQCTDKRVNQVTPYLFKKADTPEKMVALGTEEIAKIIKPCGFYLSKANHIYEMSKMLVEKYGGEVPEDFDDLLTLPGVGRKTANVITAVGFGKPAIAVDTHVFRVANRLGLAHAKDVSGTEMQLREKIDENLWGDAHHLILLHGRYVCKAIKPLCESCPLGNICPSAGKTQIKRKKD